MRKTINATVLVLLLTIPVLAGDIGMPIAPPSGGRTTQTTTATEKQKNIDYQLAATEMSMTLLQTLLGLF